MWGRFADRAAGPDFLCGLFSDGLILRSLWIEFPVEHVILLDHHASSIPVNGNGFWKAWIDTCGRLNHAQGATRESQTGYRGILDLNTLVRQSRCEGGYVRHRPHHPGKQIDVVNGLIHQRSATVQRLGAFPTAFIIIRLWP